MQEWFKDLMLGLDDVSLHSEAGVETLWSALEAMLSGMRHKRVNDLISDEAKARAMAYEVAHSPYHEYMCASEGN